MAIGRISGPLLKANLVRNGVDLAFENDLLYIDVNNARLGVNNSSPTTDIDVVGTTRSTTLTVDNQLDVGNLSITGNTISSSLDTISFAPSGSDPVIYNSKLQVDDLQLTGNTISTTVSNTNLELRPNGAGTLEVVGNTNITGDLYVSGNINTGGDITIGGNIIIGDADTDTIEFNASIASDLIPETDNTYTLGNATTRWKEIHVADLYTTTLTLPTLDIGDLTFRDSTITAATGTDFTIEGNGTGGARLGNFRFSGNTITNVQPGGITQIVQSGTGYFKIDTNNGFVPPRGNDAQRPTSYAVAGMTRYNTDAKAIEIWTGTAWASPAGASGAVSEIQANTIASSYALMLG